jgi:O-antigen ligase
MFLAHEAAERKRWIWLFACVAIISAMLANIIYLSTSRTVLVVSLILLVLFAIKRLKARGIAAAFAGAVLVAVIAWTTSPYFRGRTEAIQTELQNYEATNARTSSGERIEFWRKSIDFVRQSPVFGHGTGSIHTLFEWSAVGQTGAAGVASTNPHNQTLAVAIQLGLVGVAVLWAMWIAHLLLFRGNSFAEWIGLVIVVQNVVGSLFNSHLFDFVQGWVYVVGVGVAGGIVLKVRTTNQHR